MSGKRKGKKRQINAASKKAKKRKGSKASEKPKMATKTESIPRVEITLPIQPLKHRQAQCLISHVLQPYVYTDEPLWCRLHNASEIRKCVVVMMSYVEPCSHVCASKLKFPFLLKEGLFETLPLISPGTADSAQSGLDALLTAVPEHQKKKKKRNRISGTTRFSLEKAQYVLNPKELLANGFPVSNSVYEVACQAEDSGVAVCHEKEMESNGFVKLTKTAEISDDSQAPMYAIDCEMCETSEGMELTRVSIVNESLECIYDTLVKPENSIIDYKTEYSGITKESLESVTKTLKSVQNDICSMLPAHVILVGHSLENDLLALKLVHDAVIDTTILYTTPANRKKYKPSLRYLSKKYLKLIIQSGSDGHCSIEDAKACMRLVLLKVEKGSTFGIPVAKDSSSSFFSQLALTGKEVTLIDTPGLIRRYSGTGKVHSIPCVNDNQVLTKALKAVEKADLLWVHFHGVEVELKRQHITETVDNAALEKTLQITDSHLSTLFDSLPNGTMYIVIAGSGDLYEVNRLQKSRHSESHLWAAVTRARTGSLHVTVKWDEDDDASEPEESHVEAVASKTGEVEA